jgi:hypothetical protein
MAPFPPRPSAPAPARRQAPELRAFPARAGMVAQPGSADGLIDEAAALQVGPGVAKAKILAK